MRRLVASFTAITLAVAAPGLVSTALAHGGSYRGPPGEVPPDTREPSDPPPPPEGGGPQTPGSEQPGGPVTGGPDAGGPSTPGGGSSGGPATGGGSGGPATGGGSAGGPNTGGVRGAPASKGSGYGSWVFWWGYNKDEYLQLKTAVTRMHRGPSSAFGVGGASRPGRNANGAAIAGKVVPLLRTLLADESQSFHIRSAAELGLAKIGDTETVPTLERMALNEKKALHREIEETAALALGLMQCDSPEVRQFLIEIVREQSRDGTYARPFSAISLGLLGGKNDRELSAMTALVEVIARKEPGADIKPSCFTALGLLGDDAAVPELVAMVRNGKASASGSALLTEIETAYAVAALGKIGRPGVLGDETCAVDEALKLVDKEKSKAGTDVRRSAAIALGQIGPQCAGKTLRRVIDALKAVVGGDGEEQERNFAIMSLGRIGSANGVDAATRKDLVALLGKQMDGKVHGQTPAFAAMALGLVGRGIMADGGAAPEEEIRAPLRAKFREDGGDQHTRGAYALASGLVRDPLAADSLLKTLKDRTADKRVRGWSAIALGLIGAPDAVDAVRKTLKEETDRDLRVQVSMAAGLLGDPSVVDDLVAVLRDHDASNYELGSATLALGQVGGEDAIDALAEIAADKESRWPDQTRALAVVALGQIGDRRDVPVLTRLATDVNYRAHVPAITELLTIL